MIRIKKENDEPLIPLSQVEKMLKDFGKSLRPVKVIKCDGDTRKILDIVGYYQVADGVIIEVYEKK